MKTLKLFTSMILLLISFYGTAQVKKDSISNTPTLSGNRANGNTETKELFKRKGRFFLFWGYNWSAYSKSDIDLCGDGYDFTITDIVGKDEPVPLSSTYIKPTTFSVPQYNYRVGYFLNDKTFISIGQDHMKYVIDKQTTHLSGTI